MNFRVPLLAVCLALALGGGEKSACAGDDTLIGTGMGAALGGFLGSQIGHGGGQVGATLLGIGAGGLIGNEIGQNLDNENRSQPMPVSLDAFYSAAPPIAYSGYTPNYVAPPALSPTYIDQQAQTYCRPYSQETRINGRRAEIYGTACLQPDGTWRAMQ